MQMTKKLQAVLWLCFIGTGAAMAAEKGDAHQHEGHAAGHMSDADASSHMFLKKRDVGDYQVSFHVMAATQGMQHGGSHNLMVKVEQDGRLVENVQINSKVIFPDGKDQQRPLHQMGDWFMAGYDMQGDARHQVMVLFRTVDGEIHRSGVYYPK